MAADIEKVISGIEHCARGASGCQQNCPYGTYNFCKAWLVKDTLELLKEQNLIIDQYHKADGFLDAHGWKWEDADG